jgi:large subunit ribosomal protein L15
MSLDQHSIRPSRSKKNKKRVGRGDASGFGSFSGRGMKGQNSRSGGGVRPGFEGGQLPLIKRLPSLRGFNNVFKTQYNIVNLDTLDSRYQNGGEVNPESLVEIGVIKNNKKPVKVLGRGNLSNSLNVSAHKFSETAKNSIEEAGGSIQVIE